MAINPVYDNNTSLQISNYFLSYYRETPSHHILRAYFSLLQSEIVTRNFSSIKLEVLKTDFVNSSEDDSMESIESLINNSNAVTQSIIFSSAITLPDKVNPAALPFLKSGILPDSIESLKKQINVLSPLNPDEVPAPEQTFSATNPREVMLNLLSQYKIDPSNITFISEDPQGLVTYLKNYYTKHYLNNLSSDTQYFVQKKTVKSIDRIYLKCFVNIPKTDLATTDDLRMRIFLNDSSGGLPIYMTERVFNISDLRIGKGRVKNKPNVGFINNKIYITQKDQNSNFIAITKKTIDEIGNVSSYNSNTPNLTLAFNNSNFVSAYPGKKSIDIYRFRSISQPLFLGSSYKNLVIGDLKKVDTTSMILYDSSVQNSIIIDIVNISSYVDQIKISRRTRITGKSFGPSQDIVPYTKVTLNSASFSDNTVSSGNTYEYTLSYKTKDGLEKTSISQNYRYIKIPSVGVSTQIEDFQQSYGNNPTISFTISTTVQQNEMIKIKNLMDSLGISSQFTQDFNQIKEQLSQLLHHKVVRTNLRTGLREVFEDVSPTGEENSFIDNNSTRQTFSISSLMPGVSYRYEVKVFIRDPSTLLSTSVVQTKIIKDVNPKVNYYNPYKWKQPDVLSQGTIFAQTQDSNQKFIGKSLNDFGEIGTTASQTINYNVAGLSISNVDCSRIDISTLRISWKTSNDVSLFDHFVLVKETNKVKKIVDLTVNNEFIYPLSREDRGTIIFYIIPVLNDYNLGPPARANTIVIDPEELDSFILE